MATTTVYRSIKQQPSSLIGLLKSCSLSLAGSRLTSQAMDRKIEEYYLSTLINDSDVFPYARKGDFMSSVLSERKDIRQAQALLYANYKDHNWVWAEDNPTGKKVNLCSFIPLLMSNTCLGIKCDCQRSSRTLNFKDLKRKSIIGQATLIKLIKLMIIETFSCSLLKSVDILV